MLGLATLAVLATVAAFLAVRVVVKGVVLAAVVTVPAVVIPPVFIIGVLRSVVLARLPTEAAPAISSHSTPALPYAHFDFELRTSNSNFEFHTRRSGCARPAPSPPHPVCNHQPLPATTGSLSRGTQTRTRSRPHVQPVEEFACRPNVHADSSSAPMRC